MLKCSVNVALDLFRGLPCVWNLTSLNLSFSTNMKALIFTRYIHLHSLFPSTGFHRSHLHRTHTESHVLSKIVCKDSNYIILLWIENSQNCSFATMIISLCYKWHPHIQWQILIYIFTCLVLVISSHNLCRVIKLEVVLTAFVLRLHYWHSTQSYCCNSVRGKI